MENSIVLIIFQIVVLLGSVIIHEVSHGVMALHLGDETAKDAGRLTLNPISHIDPFGSIILPLLLFFTHSSVILGWAKPVPYNPHALYKDYIYGPLKVAIAGPLSNLVLAFIFGLIIRFNFGLLSPITIILLSYIVGLNCFLAIFNLIPIPPLDGSKILTVLLPPKYSLSLQNIGLGGIFLVMIFVFYFSDIISVPAMLLFRLFTGMSAF